MVATDLPVHTEFWGTPVDEIFKSPFFHLIWSIGKEPISELMPKIEAMRYLREKWYPPLRRAVGFYVHRDMDGMRKALKSIPGGDQLDWNATDPENIFDNAVGKLYEPFEDRDLQRSASEEFLSLCRKAKDRDEAKLCVLLNELHNNSLSEHRERVIHGAFTALGDFDALYPAMWVERMYGRVNLDDYRVMREDFPARKALYQDLFELGSRTLAFIAPVANIALRGTPNAYADGKNRTPAKARKEKSFIREMWLNDFPRARELYKPISRHTRNNIGHALVTYDVKRSVLIYEDGKEQNYLLFLIDTLAAVRLSHYLVNVMQIIEYVREAMNS